MKITIISLSFLPNVGGLENIMSGLALEWSLSNDVTVFTNTKDDTFDIYYPYKIIRKFSLYDLWKSVINSDILVEANVSLKTALIGLFHQKKWVIIHHGIYNQNTLPGRLKKILLLFANNIAVSKYVSSKLNSKAFVIYNFYNSIFKKISEIIRINDLVFVGRLVSDKGVDLLLFAIHEFKKKGLVYNLSIIGDGPEINNLIIICKKLNISNQVKFLGTLTGQSLVRKINEHKVMVIPSRWKEPFGLVALEGLACGCKIVCPDEGGLKEASGGFAFLYVHNQIDSLQNAIKLAIESKYSLDEEFLIDSHLNKLSSFQVAEAYLNHFKIILNVL